MSNLANRGTFQLIDQQNILVVGTDRTLWLEHPPFGSCPPPNRERVDTSVKAVQANPFALDNQKVFTLGTDGTLWFEFTHFNTVPPPRDKIDEQVAAFQAVNANRVYILGSDGNLWNAVAPFGTAPPPRSPTTPLDTSVTSFDAEVDGTELVVLRGEDLRLANSTTIDRNVLAMQVAGSGNFRAVWTLGTDHNLWETFGPYGPIPPNRVPVDRGVRSFIVVNQGSSPEALVLGLDGNLWFEFSPFGNGNPPPNRRLIDSNVVAFQAVGGMAMVLRSDGTLLLESKPGGFRTNNTIVRTIVDCSVASS